MCAAGRATVAALVESGAGVNALATGAYLHDGLAAIASSTGAIVDVRGAGLMVGVTLARPVAAEVAAAALCTRTRA